MSRRRTHRGLLTGLAASILFVGGVLPTLAAGAHGAHVASTGVIDPALAAILDTVAPNERIPVIVTLADQLDPSTLASPHGGAPDPSVAAGLRAHAEVTQGALRALLAAAAASGDAGLTVPLWITNAISVEVRPALIRVLAARAEVSKITADRLVSGPGTTPAATVEPGVAQVGAPVLWSLGFDGTGVTVASLDTGVDPTSADLGSRFRAGAGGWYDPYGQHSTPTDVSGHGTMTMGVMVGGSASGSSIGVAPGARWIASRIFNDSGVATTTGIHLAHQWALDPDGSALTADAPTVVNESWSLGSVGCDLTFEPDLQALAAAGIVPVFAAGNFGPTSPSSASPANNPDAFAVGAVDGTVIADFSSRGPTSCGRGVSEHYPTVVAPGVGIRTTDRFGLYTVTSGTSIAAPSAAGAVALLRQALPAVTAAELRAALRDAAVDLGAAGPDDAFGWGRLDVLAAYQRLTGSPSPTPTPTTAPTPTPTASPTPTPTAAATPTPTPSASPTPMPGDGSGPVAGSPVVEPAVTNGAAGIVIGAVVDERATGGSAVTAAEWWVDTTGAAGAGQPMTGAFGTPTVTVTGSIGPARLASLSAGPHQVLVRGRDASGNWGLVSSSTFVIDRTGPGMSALVASPDPSKGAASVTVTSTASDTSGGGSGVSAAEWFIGTDPGRGSATPMNAFDGRFDAASETVVGSVPMAGRSFGEQLVSVRARDAAGNWGAVTQGVLTVTPADAIFADGFESGSTTHWSGATGPAQLAVNSSAATAGRWGLAIALKGKNSAFVTDSTPATESAYQARFTLDARGTITGTNVIDVFAALDRKGATLFDLQYRRLSGGAAEIRAGARGASGTNYAAWAPFPAGPHAVEIGWRAAASSTLSVWIDGAPSASLGSLDTRGLAIETIRLGPSAGLANGLAGELDFDRFVSTRGSMIGP